MADFPIGLDCKAYLNTGSYGSPTWTEITTIGDVTINGDTTLAELKYRGAGWVRTKPGLKNLSIDMTMAHKASDTTVYRVIRDAWEDSTLKDYAFSDGAIATNGSEYWRMEAYVESFTRAEPLEEFVTHDITLRPGVTTNSNPASTDVSA